MKYAIGIDVGVTNIKSVLADETGKVVAQDQAPTHSDDANWPARVIDVVKQRRSGAGQGTELLGIAAPGMASPDGTRIAWMQGRLNEVEGLDWTKKLAWPRAVPVLNDAQAALLGEVWQGAAKGSRNAVLLTLGTGVGGAVLCDGRILKGHLGRAGHLGHLSLNPDGDPDVTNCPGSLEEHVGNYTLGKRTQGRFRNTHELIRAARQGDAFANDVWMSSVKALAAAVASIVNIVDPETVIIGGGIATAGETLFGPLNEYLAKFEWRPHGKKVNVVPAQLGEFAGAIGAAHNAMEGLDG